MQYYYKWITLAIVALFWAGCSSDNNVDVQGTITYKGKPIPGAEVEFSSLKKKKVYTGSTDDDGHFTISSPSSKGLPAGEYEVKVLFWVDRQMIGEFPGVSEAAEEAKSRGKYRQANADLQQTITETNEELVLDLDKDSIYFDDENMDE